MKKWIPEIFIAIVTTLVAFGVLMTYSSSVRYAEDVFNNSFHFFYKELMWLAIGLVAAVIVYKIHYQFIQKMSSWILLFSICLLVLVFLPGIGHKANNAYRWIKFAGFTFQPSEFAKLAVIIFIADRLAKNRRHVSKFIKGVFVPLIIVVIPLVLILMEPDLGTPVVITLTVFVLFYIGGTKLWHLAILIIGGIAAVIPLVLTSPYRMKRLLAFLNPDSDIANSGYQIYQSLIAIGSGQLNGVGLGKSIQKLRYLPEAHTDFVFAIVGEELGFKGAGALVLLFILFLIVAFKMTSDIRDMFGHLVATGIITMLTLQAIINIGVVTSCLPTKGIALPFISYGGSSMIFSLTACGLLLNIYHNRNDLKSDKALTRTFDETVI